MDPSSFPGLSAIGQVAVSVHDIERATRFYRDTLGMKLLFQGPGLAFFDCQGVRLMLSTPSTPELGPPSSLIYYRVPDIDAAHATLRERGVEFEIAPRMTHADERHELWLAFFRDPDRNVVALMGERPVS